MASKSTSKKKTKKTASLRARKAFTNALENGGNMSKAMRDAGYSDAMAKNPQKLTQSDAWQELLDKHLSDKTIIKKHKELLNATRIEHMTFPPFNEEKKDNEGKGEQLADEEIIELLASVNCTVRKIVHGDMVRHVYFWAADNMARDKALDKIYKLKGLYSKDGTSVNVQVNNQINNNKIIFAEFHGASS